MLQRGMATTELELVTRLPVLPARPADSNEGTFGLALAVLADCQIPLMLAADGLNAVQGHAAALKNRTAPLILTPHPGEFARLLGTDIAYVRGHRQDLAVRFAA